MDLNNSVKALNLSEEPSSIDSSNLENITSDEEDDGGVEYLGVYFTHLSTGEKFVAQTFFDEEDPDEYWFHLPVKVIELVTEDDYNLRFLPFNSLLKTNVITIQSSHIIYMGQINDSFAEAYDNFVSSLVEMRKKHESEQEKESKSENVVKKDKNIVFGNFSKKKDSVNKIDSDEDSPPPTAA